MSLPVDCVSFTPSLQSSNNSLSWNLLSSLHSLPSLPSAATSGLIDLRAYKRLSFWARVHSTTPITRNVQVAFQFLSSLLSADSPRANVSVCSNLVPWYLLYSARAQQMNGSASVNATAFSPPSSVLSINDAIVSLWNNNLCDRMFVSEPIDVTSEWKQVRCMNICTTFIKLHSEFASFRHHLCVRCLHVLV